MVHVSYHHVQVIHMNPVSRVQPALVALIRLRLYHFDKVRIDVPISIVPVRTAIGLIKQTLKHRFHWIKLCDFKYFVFQGGIHGRVCIYRNHIQKKKVLIYIFFYNSISKMNQIYSINSLTANFERLKIPNIYFKVLIICPERHIKHRG